MSRELQNLNIVNPRSGCEEQITFEQPKGILPLSCTRSGLPFKVKQEASPVGSICLKRNVKELDKEKQWKIADLPPPPYMDQRHIDPFSNHLKPDSNSNQTFACPSCSSVLQLYDVKLDMKVKPSPLVIDCSEEGVCIDCTESEEEEELEKEIEKPACYYGSDCYRTNPLHLSQYTHPSESQSESEDEDEGEAQWEPSKEEENAAKRMNELKRVVKSCAYFIVDEQHSESEESDVIEGKWDTWRQLIEGPLKKRRRRFQL
jgi:hypothetical protein